MASVWHLRRVQQRSPHPRLRRQRPRHIRPQAETDQKVETEGAQMDGEDAILYFPTFVSLVTSLIGWPMSRQDGQILRVLCGLADIEGL